MSVGKTFIAGILTAAGVALATAASAMPVGDIGSPLPEGSAKIEKVERVCRPDGSCFNKYTGAPMRGYAIPQSYPRPYYQQRPRYVEPEYRQPRRYYERRDYY